MPLPVSVVHIPPDVDPDPFTHGRTVGTFLGGNGDLVQLTSCPTGIDWQFGRSGGDMPPFDTGEDPYPAGDGSIPRPSRATPRTHILPLLVHMARWVDWRAVQQTLLRALNPLDGDGVLTIYQPDGSARQIGARYIGGAEGQDVMDLRGLWFRKYPVALKSFDPFWSDVQPHATIRFGNISPSVHLLDAPFLPLKLADAQSIGTTDADNIGDVPAYPVWTINGPATVVTLTNDTTGETLTVTHTLTGGQSIIIDTRPLRKSIVTNLGANLWASTGANPSLWSLARGLNHLTITVAGSDATTNVLLDFTPRYLSE